jgi:hypothetical protein
MMRTRNLIVLALLGSFQVDASPLTSAYRPCLQRLRGGSIAAEAMGSTAEAMGSTAEAMGSAAGYVWEASNQMKLGISFFNNIRTPAALIGGAALANAFALSKLPNDERFDTWQWRLASQAYVMMMLLAFGLEFMTIFMATAVGVRLMAGGYNPTARSAVEMLVREFELEYVTIRCQFFTGVLSFLIAQSIRVRRELSLVSPPLGRAGFFFLLYAVLNVLSFFGKQLVFYDGYFSLVRSFFSLNVKSFRTLASDPCAMLATLFLVGTAVSIGQTVYDKASELFGQVEQKPEDQGKEITPY